MLFLTLALYPTSPYSEGFGLNIASSKEPFLTFCLKQDPILLFYSLAHPCMSFIELFTIFNYMWLFYSLIPFTEMSLLSHLRTQVGRDGSGMYIFSSAIVSAVTHKRSTWYLIYRKY